MCSSFNVQDHVQSMDDWEEIWHKSFKRRNPKWQESEMYLNAQFDDIPYRIWEDNELIEEFDYHYELIEYDKRKNNVLS